MKNCKNWDFTLSLVVLEQKCQLLTPHNFGSRVPSLSTEIGISRRPLWKITKLGFYTVPGGPRAKVSITDPPQFWVKGSIIVDEKSEFLVGHYKKSRIWVFYTVPSSPSAKVSITDPPTILGQGFHCCRQKSEFLVGHSEKSQNWVFTRSLVVLEQKCQLPTPHKFGSMVPLLPMEIEISPSAIMKNHKIGFCMFPVGPRAKVSITNLPQVWVKGSIIVDGNRNFTFDHYEKSQNWGLHAPCWS